MIQVLLLILKIIGITILVVLGLILLVLALVLFVPVFYRVRVIHNPDKTHVTGRVSFLFPLLLVTLEYLQKFKYKVRVFGFAVLNSEKPKKEKKVKPKKPKKAKKKKQSRKRASEQEPIPEEKPEPFWEPLTGVPTETVVETATEPDTESAVKSEAEKTGFFEKIRLKIHKTRETISNISKKIKKLLHQKAEVQRVLNKPETKQAISFVWKELKHLLKHVLPRKIKGYVAYGADNPATTGQVLGVLGVVYAKTGQLLEIRPNFAEKQLECDIELKGHIQVFTLLVIAVKVFLHQELRQLITEFKHIKEIE